MLGTDAVKDAQDPALEVGDDNMHPREQIGSVFYYSRNQGLMVKTESGHWLVGTKAVCGQDTSRSDIAGGRRSQTYGTNISDHLHVSQTAAAAFVLLAHDGHRGLACGPAAPNPFDCAAYVGFVHLHHTRQHQLPLTSAHGMSDQSAASSRR